MILLSLYTKKYFKLSGLPGPLFLCENLKICYNYKKGGYTMEIIQAIMTECPCYKANQAIKPTHIILHSTGVAQPKASAYINQFKRPDYTRASAHAFIDGNDLKVYQTLPWDINGWHCGGSANAYSIGIEMCEGGDIDKMFNVASDLLAHLCSQYNIQPANILGHYEAYKLGMASNHSDPLNYLNKYNMNDVRTNVQKILNEQGKNTQVVKHEIIVQSIASTLNRRDKPGMDGKIIGKQCKGYENKIINKQRVNGSWWLQDVAGYWISADWSNDVILTCNTIQAPRYECKDGKVIGYDKMGYAHRIKSYNNGYAQDIAGYWIDMKAFKKSLNKCKL